MGLLDYLTVHSLDEDYAEAAAGSVAPAGRPHRSPTWRAAAVVLVFGLLLAVAAVQSSRSAAVVEAGRVALIEQIRNRSSQLAARRDLITQMRREVTALQARSAGLTVQERRVTEQLGDLGVPTGAAPVSGPGVQIVVDDATNPSGPQEQVLDRDLQKLVNGLWESGAEAVAINGQRLSTLSAVRQAGPAITVNYRSLARPYVVSAIGDPDAIPARFVETRHGAAWLDLRAAYGLRFEMESQDSLTLPASDRLALRYARPRRSAR